VTSRRSLILGAAAVAAGGIGLGAADRLDDTVRALGARPKALPDDADAKLLADVHADQRRLLARSGTAPVAARNALAEQLRTVGGDPRGVVPQRLGGLATEIAAAADLRAAQAVQARSGKLAQVLASMAAGLDMLAASLT
jgi:hypothetical protein